MALTNVASRLTAAERAREPRHLHVVAWFDGNARGGNPSARPADFPRRLTTDEAKSWREGFTDGWRERVCHSWHGFIPCPGDHPRTIAPEDHDIAIYLPTLRKGHHR